MIKRRCCVIVNAYAEDCDYLYQARRMQEEFAAAGFECDIKKNSVNSLKIDGDVTSPFSGYDFVVYWDKDKYTLSALEKIGVKTFNAKRGIELCDDKLSTYIALSGCGLPLVKTIPAPLCYTDGASVSNETLDAIENALRYPLIVKEAYGSLGRGVRLVGDRVELKRAADELIFKPHFYQEYISTSRGKDVRVIAVGDKVVGAMERYSATDFRSNIGAGGNAVKLEVTAEMEEITLKAKKALGLDYCGIDLLYGKNGELVICEVNSNAFFKTFERVTGVNVAKAYVEYIASVVG